jgi:uncharacterized protein
MKTKSLLPFFAITFGLTWGISAVLLFFSEQVIAIFGEIGLSNPLIILLIYSPSFAGIFLVWKHYGIKGLGSFLKRLTLWRAPLVWWLFLILGIPAVVYIGAAIKGSFSDPFPFAPWYQAFPALAFALILGPMEEFGWRGVALPLMQRKFAPFWAGLIIGVIWALWHIPSFLSDGMPQSNWDVVPFFLGIIAVSIILTPIFNASRGSLLISALFHLQIMNPIFPDAQPWDNLLYVVVAVIVVLLNRRKMFSHSSEITDVLMPEKSVATNQQTQIIKTIPIETLNN